MKKFKNVAGLLVAFLAVMFFGSGMTIPVNAEEVPAYRIGVTPTQQAFPELKPGEEYQGSLKLVLARTVFLMKLIIQTLVIPQAILA